MSKGIPERVQRRIEEMTEGYRQSLMAMYEWSNGEEEVGSLAVKLEAKIREWIKGIGHEVNPGNWTPC